jgi:hypothetical protein
MKLPVPGKGQVHRLGQIKANRGNQKSVDGHFKKTRIWERIADLSPLLAPE